MNPDIKSRWVHALRDGYFKKGRHGLRDLDDHYDAQGVLCELAVSEGIIGAPQRYDKPEASVFFGYMYSDSEGKHATGLPAAVCKWADIDYRTAFKVGLMGDSGKSFAKIADWIEENL